MDVKQGREVVAQYRSLLQHLPKTKGPLDRPPAPREAMSHLHGMLDKMDEFLDEWDNPMRDIYEDPMGSWEKFNRWLGFVQGVFWINGTFTLNQMRTHNRSNSSTES